MRRTLGIALVLGLATGVIWLPQADAAVTPSRTTSGYSCTISTQDPHATKNPTTGQPEAIVKTNFDCTAATVAAVELYLVLFWCPFEPQGPESSWPSQGCSVLNTHADAVTPTPGTVYTRQVTSGEDPPSGWYIGCTLSAVDTPNSDGTVTRHSLPNVWSASVYLTFPAVPIILPPAPG